MIVFILLFSALRLSLLYTPAGAPGIIGAFLAWMREDFLPLILDEGLTPILDSASSVLRDSLSTMERGFRIVPRTRNSDGILTFPEEIRARRMRTLDANDESVCNLIESVLEAAKRHNASLVEFPGESRGAVAARMACECLKTSIPLESFKHSIEETVMAFEVDKAVEAHEREPLARFRDLLAILVYLSDAETLRHEGFIELAVCVDSVVDGAYQTFESTQYEGPIII